MRIEQEQIGKRLDLFLVEFLQEAGYATFSRSYLTKNWEGLVKVNGQDLKPSYKLRVGDEVDVDMEKVNHLKESMQNSSELIGQQAPNLDILFEDENFLILEKPHGLVVHPGIGNREGTLANYVRGYLEEKGEFDKGLYRGGLVHRLDKGVAGLMVFAKNLHSQKHLQEQFENREVKKIYLADIEYVNLRRGIKKIFKDIDVDGGIDKEITALEKNNFSFGSDWFKASGYIKRSQTNRVKMTFRKYLGRNGKKAVSYIKALNKEQLLIVIETGRMHQIRATLEYYGIGIKGDTLYGLSKSDRMPDKIYLKSIYLSFKEQGGDDFTIIKY